MQYRKSDKELRTIAYRVFFYMCLQYIITYHVITSNCHRGGNPKTRGGTSNCILWCNDRYDFRIKTTFGSSYLRLLYVFMYSGFQHILCCVFVLCFFVLCILCCQFLHWIIHFWLPLRYFLTCLLDNRVYLRLMICVPNVASFSGLSIFDCLIGIF